MPSWQATWGAELTDGQACFGKDSEVLMKFHGFYQQDDRDARTLARKEGGDKAYIFMVRTKIPGGKLTSELAGRARPGDEVGNTTLRCTTRKGLQLHGVVKGDLKKTIRKINDLQLSTLGACGD